MTEIVSESTQNLLSDFSSPKGIIRPFQGIKNGRCGYAVRSFFGSPPNWHIAHATRFFHKVLENLPILKVKDVLHYKGVLNKNMRGGQQ